MPTQDCLVKVKHSGLPMHHQCAVHGGSVIPGPWIVETEEAVNLSEVTSITLKMKTGKRVSNSPIRESR